MRQPAHTFPTIVSPRSLLSHLRRMALGLALGLVVLAAPAPSPLRRPRSGYCLSPVDTTTT